MTVSAFDTRTAPPRFRGNPAVTRQETAEGVVYLVRDLYTQRICRLREVERGE